MKKSKIIIAAGVLLFVFLVGGAIAYFTDTDEKTNTFTIGNVEISLNEDHWSLVDADNSGVPDASENIMPGQTIAKDPKVTNESASNAAYVFTKVVVPCTSEATPRELFTYNVNSGWTELSTAAVACTNGNATHVYYYGSNNSLTSLAAGATTPNAVFDNVTLLSNLTGAASEGLTGNKNVVVTGYGIQTQGLPEPIVPATVWGYF